VVDRAPKATLSYFSKIEHCTLYIDKNVICLMIKEMEIHKSYEDRPMSPD